MQATPTLTVTRHTANSIRSLKNSHYPLPGIDPQQQLKKWNNIIKALIMYRFEKSEKLFRGLGTGKTEGREKLLRACDKDELFADDLLKLATNQKLRGREDFPPDLFDLLNEPDCDDVIIELLEKEPQILGFLEKNSLWPRPARPANYQAIVANYVQKICGNYVNTALLLATFQANLNSLSKQYNLIVSQADIETMMIKITTEMCGNTSHHMLINPLRYYGENYIFWNTCFQFGPAHKNSSMPNHPFTFSDGNQIEPLAQYVVRRSLQAAIIHGHLLKAPENSIVGLAEFADQNKTLPDIHIPGYQLISHPKGSVGLCALVPQGVANQWSMTIDHRGETLCIQRTEDLPDVYIVYRQGKDKCQWHFRDKHDTMVMGDFNASVTSTALGATDLMRDPNDDRQLQMFDYRKKAVDYILHIPANMKLSVDTQILTRPDGATVQQPVLVVPLPASILPHTQHFAMTEHGNIEMKL